MIEVLIGICVVILIYFILGPMKCSDCNGFTSKPNTDEIYAYSDEIIKNRDFFKGNHSIYEVRNTLPWIDPIMYEDVIQLSRKNNLNKKNVMKIFH